MVGSEKHPNHTNERKVPIVSKKASYREIGGPGGLLAHCQPFQGNTMSARLDESASGRSVYDVYSYRTIIFRFYLDTGEVMDFGHYYSVTTTRQQNLCRAWIGTAFAGLYEERG